MSKYNVNAQAEQQMQLLADTSIMIALVANEEEKSIITEVIKNHKLLCSTSIYVEVGNAISAMFERERITLVQAIEILNDFEQLSFETVDFDLRRAIQISHKCKIYAYDAYVLECANRLNLPLMTLDKLMQEKAKQLNITIIEV
jgi:predicted nucleic acid-binding protein